MEDDDSDDEPNDDSVPDVRCTSRPRIYLYNYYDIYILYAKNSRLLYYCLIN